MNWYKRAAAQGHELAAAFVLQMAGGSESSRPPKALTSTKDGVDVIEFSAKITQQGRSVAHWSWKATLKNNTAATIRVFAKIQFLDRDGFELDYGLKNMEIGGGARITVTDSVPIETDVSGRISRAQLSLQ